MNRSRQEHPFAHYVRILGKGKTGSRNLTLAEARDALGMILREEAEDVQVGAFLMLLRVKEESPEEIVGFVQACRAAMLTPDSDISVDVDWASYAGKKHQHPWYVLTLLLLSQAGYRTVIHGSAGHTPGRLYTQDAFRALGLPVADDWNAVEHALDNESLCYMPLQVFCPVLDSIMQLRPLLGLRSPVNTLARLLNPLAATHSIQSVFHPAYASVHRSADRALQQPSSLVFKGESGEAEVKPHADTRMYFLHDGKGAEEKVPRTIARRVQPVEVPRVEPVRELWTGQRNDDYGLRATLATTAAALLLLNPRRGYNGAIEQATVLWHARNKHRLM